ncbi:uncharacterized protein [Hemitrygon akajei]|uniref:uncharacterized protein n=1 Tax=Hemitrygon akajei TaxID=2704970 RepID=UPI003BF978F1
MRQQHVCQVSRTYLNQNPTPEIWGCAGLFYCNAPCCSSSSRPQIRKIFDHPVRYKDAAKRLLALRQGSRSVAEYSVEFRTLAADSGWNDEALQEVFQQGLCDKTRMQIPATVNYQRQCLTLSALVDSGAEGNLLDEDIASQAGIPHKPLTTPLEARALEGRLLARVTHCTPPLTLILSGNHPEEAEKCEFHVPSVSFLGYIIESGQMRADPEKIRTVEEWPGPTTCKQRRRFLGFANFCRRLIRDYNRVPPPPLTRPTSPTTPFCWDSETDSAFTDLKRRFTTAPILVHPDTARQFIVEVDASDSGIGAVLFQQSSSDEKLHPCAFYSGPLSPTDWNYDAGNRELLAVKLALEEWRNWLEGAEQPFVIWTDHKNIGYIQTAKRLNFRQETADFLVRHVFRLHGFPADIVSDRGPHDIVYICTSAALAMEATISCLCDLTRSITWPPVKSDRKRPAVDSEGFDISGQDCLMSVTGDTTATNQKMEKPLQLIYNKDGKLQVNPEALNVLQSIDDPMVVVAVVGAAHTGKSYLMNCLAGDRNGFSVDSTLQSHTKGIWMWCRSLPQRPNEVLLLLDTECFVDPEMGDNQNDRSIYLLATLLSSILIYNSQNKIDHQSLQDLHFVTELSKRIQMRSQHDGCDRWDFVRVFPEFVWVIRDLTLDMNIDGKDMTPNEYLEHSLKLKDSEISEQDKEYNELRRCIRDHFPSRCCFAFPIPTHGKKLKQLQELEDKDLDEDFVTERQNLINYIHTHKKVKRVLGGQLVTGRRFVELTKAYVGMMADGVLPCVERCLVKLAAVENQAAVDEALKFYDDEMKKISESGCLTMNKVIEYNNMKSREAFNIFHKRSMNNNSGKYIQQLEKTMHSIYKSVMANIKETSQQQCKVHLAKEMSSIKQNLASSYYQRPGGFQKLKVELNHAIKKYEEKTKDEMEGCAVLASFLEEGKPHLDQVQEMEEQMHVSALEEQLSRLKEDMEKMEQKRKAAEECRNKENKEQIRKSFEEGKMCNVQELKEAMEHTRSEMEKYRVEGREGDAERAQQMYKNLEKKHEEATKWSFMKFVMKSVTVIFPALLTVVAFVKYK